MTEIRKASRPAHSAAQAEVLRIGATRIAFWIGRSESAVYQWLRRRDPRRPIPAEHMPAIVRRAREDGVSIDAALLWPEHAAVAEALAEAAA